MLAWAWLPFILAAPPDAPEPLIELQVTSTTLTLGWHPPDDGGVPIVAYALLGGLTDGPLRPVYDPLLAGELGDPDRRTFTAQGLTPQTNYTYKLRATNSQGHSEWSEPAYFVTTARLLRVSSVVPAAGP